MCKELMKREYQNKPSLINQDEEETLAVQDRDGKLIMEQEDFLDLKRR
jgi:hypothetical protein